MITVNFVVGAEVGGTLGAAETVLAVKHTIGSIFEYLESTFSCRV